MEISSSHHPITTSSSSSNGSHTTKSPLPSPTTVTRSDPSNPYPTTFVQADTSSFKQVVQMLTGSSDPPPKKPNPIPPIKPTHKSKLYERRNNSLKHLRINHPHFNNTTNTDMLSPSMLDFPGLVLSPVTPLIHDPFIRSPVSSNCSPQQNGVVCVDKVAEEKAIAEKGFYLHPVSPATEPRLLPLFPLTSPKADHNLHQPSKLNYNDTPSC